MSRNVLFNTFVAEGSVDFLYEAAKHATPVAPKLDFPDCSLRQGAGGTEFARFGSRTCFLR